MASHSSSSSATATALGAGGGVGDLALTGMHDPRLRPRLLLLLLSECLPLPDPDPDADPESSRRLGDLAYALDAVRAHGLLAERAMDPGLLQEWRAAVDAWVERLLALLRSDREHSCWVGTSFLGLTFQECCDERFAKSYSDWFAKVLKKLKAPSSTKMVSMVTCTTMADLFVRLAKFTNLQDEATSLAQKVVQPSLRLLDENGLVAEKAVDLLGLIMKLFPSSVYRHFNKVESIISGKIMSGQCNLQQSKKLASTLALLPCARVYQSSLSQMIRKILIVVNGLLNETFHGLEEENTGQEIMMLLIPPGSTPPPPLGSQRTYGDGQTHSTKKIRASAVPTISALIHCCSVLLNSSYPIQVNIPVRALVTLIQRVLLVNISSHKSLFLSNNPLHHELIYSEIPTLHSIFLDLLGATIKGMRSSLLPHAGTVGMLIDEFFKRANLPDTRRKLYTIVQLLLSSMGVASSPSKYLKTPLWVVTFPTHARHHRSRTKRSLALLGRSRPCPSQEIHRVFRPPTPPAPGLDAGAPTGLLAAAASPISTHRQQQHRSCQQKQGMVMHLLQVVVSNTFADLDDNSGSNLFFLSTDPIESTNWSSLKSSSRSNQASLQTSAVVSSEPSYSRKSRFPLSVKIAALETLEVLMNMGGSFSGCYWRTEMDLLLINVARDSCYKAGMYEQTPSSTEDPSVPDFQLASLKVLMTSFLSCPHERPPYLAQGLELFNRGKLETGTELAKFCSHALLALHVRVHPRGVRLPYASKRVLPLERAAHIGHCKGPAAPEKSVLNTGRFKPPCSVCKGPSTDNLGDEVSNWLLSTVDELTNALVEDTSVEKYAAVELSKDPVVQKDAIIGEHREIVSYRLPGPLQAVSSSTRNDVKMAVVGTKGRDGSCSYAAEFDTLCNPPGSLNITLPGPKNRGDASISNEERGQGGIVSGDASRNHGSEWDSLDPLLDIADFGRESAFLSGQGRSCP